MPAIRGAMSGSTETSGEKRNTTRDVHQQLKFTGCRTVLAQIISAVELSTLTGSIDDRPKTRECRRNLFHMPTLDLITVAVNRLGVDGKPIDYHAGFFRTVRRPSRPESGES